MIGYPSHAHVKLLALFKIIYLWKYKRETSQITTSSNGQTSQFCYTDYNWREIPTNEPKLLFWFRQGKTLAYHPCRLYQLRTKPKTKDSRSEVKGKQVQAGLLNHPEN